MKLYKPYMLFFLLLCTRSVFSQVSEYEYKAAFLERFTRFVEWPSEDSSATFRIVILGDNPFGNTLDNLFTGHTIKDQQVELIYADAINDIDSIDLLFIASSEKRRAEDILLALDQKATLIIGDSKGFAEKGVHINMYLKDSYVKYEINQQAIAKTGLIVSSLLYESAKIVTYVD